MQRYIRLCLLSFLQLILFAVLSAQDLRVATYNLKNYLVMDRYVDSSWRPAYPKPEKEKLIIREVIKEVAPDVLVLQEMGTVDFLEELRADLYHDGLHYEYAVHMKGSDPDRHLAVLARRAPYEVIKHKDLQFKYFEERETVKRGMLEMSFKLDDGRSFQLFAVHLKSRYSENKDDPGSELRRVREAEACRHRIIERTQDQAQTQYLVVGDFNDHPTSSTLRRFYRRGSLEIGTRVPAADSRGEVWTYFYEKESRYEAVDGFIASPEMYLWVKAGQGHIVDTPGALNGSDHRMVYLDLVTPAVAISTE